MKLSYESPSGTIELSAFINEETKQPTYILTLFGKSSMLDPQTASLLKQHLIDDIETDTSILEASNPTGTNKKLKKNIHIILKDTIDPYRYSGKNTWEYFQRYIVALFKFVRDLYNAMSIEQKNHPETKKLNMLLNELNV